MPTSCPTELHLTSGLNGDLPSNSGTSSACRIQPRRFGLVVGGYEVLKKRVVELEGALAEEKEAHRRSLQEIEARLASERPLGMRERDSLLQIIIAMAIDLGDYKRDGRSKLLPRITQTLELLGLRLSIDTVRKHMHRKNCFQVLGLKNRRPAAVDAVVLVAIASAVTLARSFGFGAASVSTQLVAQTTRSSVPTRSLSLRVG